MITFHTTVVRVERRSRILSARKVGDSVETEEQDLGWFVLFAGSHEMLHMGFDEPSLKAGQKVTIRIEGR